MYVVTENAICISEKKLSVIHCDTLCNYLQHTHEGIDSENLLNILKLLKESNNELKSEVIRVISISTANKNPSDNITHELVEYVESFKDEYLIKKKKDTEADLEFMKSADLVTVILTNIGKNDPQAIFEKLAFKSL